MVVAKMQQLVEGRQWSLQKCSGSLRVVEMLLQNAAAR